MMQQFCFWIFYPKKMETLIQKAQLFASPWTVARQAPLSMEFCRQEYWSG